jgi:hypothetical protein
MVEINCSVNRVNASFLSLLLLTCCLGCCDILKGFTMVYTCSM